MVSCTGVGGNNLAMCRPAKRRQQLDISYKGYKGNAKSSNIESSVAESSGLYIAAMTRAVTTRATKDSR